MNSMSGMMSNLQGRRGASGGSSRGNETGNFTGDVIPKGYKQGQLQQFTPEQLELFQQMLGYLGPDSDLGRLAGGDESMFEQMEAPAWRKFQEAQGQLGSRFSQLAPGAMSAQKGSGFQNSAGQLGSDFAMNLASNRQNLQRQALMDMFGMSNSLLNQRPYSRFMEQKPQKQEESGWGSLIGGALGGVGGAFFGNPLLGAQLGSSAGSYF